MKGTKIMLGFLCTILCTWILLATIAFLLSDSLTFKQSFTNGVVLTCMLMFGWIPAIIVGIDLEEKSY